MNYFHLSGIEGFAKWIEWYGERQDTLLSIYFLDNDIAIHRSLVFPMPIVVFVSFRIMVFCEYIMTPAIWTRSIGNVRHADLHKHHIFAVFKLLILLRTTS